MTSLSYMCWRKVITNSATQFEDAYPGWPPVKIHADGALDLEFSPFLVADNVTIDSASYDQLVREPPKGLERAIASLRRLYDEGYLVVVDYSRQLDQIRPRVLAATEVKLKSPPESFIESIRTAIEMWDKEGPKYASAIGRKGDSIASLPIGILAGLACQARVASDENVADVRRIIKKKKWTKLERDLLREVARPYIEHAHTGIALYSTGKVRSPVIDWSDLAPVYEFSLLSHIEPANPVENEIVKVRELFTTGLSTFEPSSVEQFLHALRDSRIADLRAFVTQAAQDSKSFDPTFVQDLVFQISRRHKMTGRTGSVINAIGTAAGVIASCFDGGVISSVLTGAAVGGAQEGASRAVDRITARDIKWFLCLVDAKGAK